MVVVLLQKTALMYAAEQGHAETVELLLKGGADANLQVQSRNVHIERSKRQRETVRERKRARQGKRERGGECETGGERERDGGGERERV